MGDLNPTPMMDFLSGYTLFGVSHPDGECSIGRPVDNGEGSHELLSQITRFVQFYVNVSRFFCFRRHMYHFRMGMIGHWKRRAVSFGLNCLEELMRFVFALYIFILMEGS